MPLHRPPIHDKDGRSPPARRRNVKELDPDVDDVGEDNRRVLRSTDKKPNILYPDLQDGQVTDDEDGVDDIDGEADMSDENFSAPPKTQGGKRKGRSPAPRSPPRERIPKESPDEDTNQNSCFRYLILVFGILFLAGGVYLYINKSNPDHSPTDDAIIDYYAQFKPKLNDLQRQFPSQSARFWKIVNAPLRRVLQTPESQYPAILLIGVPFNGTNTAKCFGKKLLERVNSVFSTKSEFYINAQEVIKSSPAHTKLELDNNLKQVLESGNGVVLDHIESLPAESALLLHGYCDGDNAPYKKSVIVLIFHTDKEFGNLDDHTFEDHLTEVWQEGLGRDEMPALRSRLANNVVIVNPEANMKC